MTAPTTLAADLRAAVAGLDAYIERRAQELAAPQIALAHEEANGALRDARAAAGARIGELAAELQRKDDVLAEVRRRMAVLDRRSAESAAASEALSVALGHGAHSALPLASLVEEAVRLIEKAREGQ